MKNIFTIIFTLLITATAFSQGDYDDLIIMKADQNWDKLIRSSEKYTIAKSTSKEAEPYYFLAYGLYKVSFESDRHEKYKNAYKDAYNAIGRMLRYDKSGDVQSKYEDFVEELKLSLLEMIQNELDVEQYPRAFGWAMRYYKFGRDYTPAYFLDAALRYRRQDRTTANLKWQEGEKLLQDANVPSWSDADKKIFMLGLYSSAQALKEDRQMQLAKDMMNKGAPYFEDNEDWNELYDEIIN